MKRQIFAALCVFAMGAPAAADCIALDQETERKVAELSAQAQGASGACQSLRILDQMMKTVSHFLTECPEADPGQRQLQEVRKSHKGVKDGLNQMC